MPSPTENLPALYRHNALGAVLAAGVMASATAGPVGFWAFLATGAAAACVWLGVWFAGSSWGADAIKRQCTGYAKGTALSDTLLGIAILGMATLGIRSAFVHDMAIGLLVPAVIVGLGVIGVVLRREAEATWASWAPISFRVSATAPGGKWLTRTLVGLLTTVAAAACSMSLLTEWSHDVGDWVGGALGCIALLGAWLALLTRACAPAVPKLQSSRDGTGQACALVIDVMPAWVTIALSADFASAEDFTMFRVTTVFLLLGMGFLAVVSSRIQTQSYLRDGWLPVQGRWIHRDQISSSPQELP